MCAINFIWDKKGKLDEKAILAMNRVSKHRGEDFSRYLQIKFQNQNLFFGHNRLKIIDLSEDANQPFTDEKQKKILIYNGEIYNYKTLQNRLKEFSFKTQSDTEVLFYFLQKYSPEEITQLNGMFAFLFCDIEKEKIQIVRDKQKVKPLYFFENEDYFLLSSELKSLLATKLFPRKLNQKQVFHYLQYRFANSNETFFENIFEVVEPFEINLKTLSKNYFPYPQKKRSFDIAKISSNEIVKVSEDKLMQAIENQLIADVPIALFLSGGVDSTLLLAITKELAYDLPAFSISNAENEKSFGTEDFFYAQKAAKKYKVSHHNIQTSVQDISYLSEILPRLDQPIADTSLILTYLLAKEAKKEVKVVLSGAGADEVFAGYNRHKAYYFYLKNKSFLPFFLFFKKTQFLFPDGFSHPFRKQFRLLKKLFRSLDRNTEQTLYNFTKLNLETSVFLGNGFQNDKNINDILFFDQENFLANDVLKLSDNMTMLHSLELRVPYLDQGLSDFVNTLPFDFLLKNGKKWILKQLLEKRGGKFFTQRQKEGFGFPFGLWLKNHKIDFVLDKLQNQHNPVFEFLDYWYFQKMLRKHLKSKADFTSEIWTVYLLGEWLDYHL